MNEHTEMPQVASIGELFESRRRAQTQQKAAEVAILGVLRQYQNNQTLVRVVGFPMRVAAPHYDQDGVVTGRTQVYFGSLASSKEGRRQEPRSIDQGSVANVRREMQGLIVSVEPIGTDTWWQFGLDSIVEIEAIDQEEISGRLRAQRAIISSEAFWGIDNFRADSPRLDP